MNVNTALSCLNILNALFPTCYRRPTLFSRSSNMEFNMEFNILKNLMNHKRYIHSLGIILTSSHQRSCIHAKIVPIDNRRTFKHAFRFLCTCTCMWPGDLSTRHVWRAIVAPDLYTRSRLSGLRFGSQGQKVLQTMNEFTLFVDFCLIPLSKTCSFDIIKRPLISLRYAVCSTGRWSIIGRCVGACQRSNCAEERRPYASNLGVVGFRVLTPIHRRR